MTYWLKTRLTNKKPDILTEDPTHQPNTWLTDQRPNSPTKDLTHWWRPNSPTKDLTHWWRPNSPTKHMTYWPKTQLTNQMPGSLTKDPTHQPKTWHTDQRPNSPTKDLTHWWRPNSPTKDMTYWPKTQLTNQRPDTLTKDPTHQRPDTLMKTQLTNQTHNLLTKDPTHQPNASHTDQRLNSSTKGLTHWPKTQLTNQRPDTLTQDPTHQPKTRPTDWRPTVIKDLTGWAKVWLTMYCPVSMSQMWIFLSPAPAYSRRVPWNKKPPITVIIIIIMTALKRAFVFCTISSLCRELSPTCSLKWPGRNCVQIMCNTLGTHHVQHVVCHVLWRERAAIKFDRVQIPFNLALYYWLKPLTDEPIIVYFSSVQTGPLVT